MAKSSSSHTNGATTLPLDALQPEAIRAACGQSVQQLRDMSEAWLASLRRAMDAGWDLAANLPACTEPAEAMRLYSEWLRMRCDAMAVEGKAFSEQWLKLCRVDPSLMSSAILPFKTGPSGVSSPLATTPIVGAAAAE